MCIHSYDRRITIRDSAQSECPRNSRATPSLCACPAIHRITARLFAGPSYCPKWRLLCHLTIVSSNPAHCLAYHLPSVGRGLIHCFNSVPKMSRSGGVSGQFRKGVRQCSNPNQCVGSPSWRFLDASVWPVRRRHWLPTSRPRRRRWRRPHGAECGPTTPGCSPARPWC